MLSQGTLVYTLMLSKCNYGKLCGFNIVKKVAFLSTEITYFILLVLLNQNVVEH